MRAYADYRGCNAASLAPAECFKNLAMQFEWRRNVFAFGAAHPLVKIPPGEVAFIRVLTKSAIGGKLEDMSQVGQAKSKRPRLPVIRPNFTSSGHEQVSAPKVPGLTTRGS